MTTSTIQRLKAAGQALAAALLVAVAAPQASALEINTTAFQAVAELQLSIEAYGASSAAGITFSSLGSTTNGKGQVVDIDFAPSFLLPVTSADVSVGWDLKLKPVAGEAVGAGLLVQRGLRGFGLGNFEIDYARDQVMADFFLNGTTTRMAVFGFTELSDLDIGLKGLGLNMHQTLGNLRFTTQAADSFASALRLSEPLKAALVGMDFGTITIDINTSLRWPVSATPLTAAAVVVSEPGSTATMMLGLAGVSLLLLRRKQRQ